MLAAVRAIRATRHAGFRTYSERGMRHQGPFICISILGMLHMGLLQGCAWGGAVRRAGLFVGRLCVGRGSAWGCCAWGGAVCGAVVRGAGLCLSWGKTQRMHSHSHSTFSLTPAHSLMLSCSFSRWHDVFLPQQLQEQVLEKHREPVTP